ncbi:lipopolysaccharide kinase InaA family protein [Flavobacterium pedocola]
MNFIVDPKKPEIRNEILKCIDNFGSSGELFGDGKRNKIKLFQVNDLKINVKSFKKPFFFNKLIYSYFRKSKARRSFEFACFLLEKGIKTPVPIAYCEKFDFLGLAESFYVSEHFYYDLTFRELVECPDYEDHEFILRQFTRFSFELHEKGVEFLDHSPGNTLIKKNSSSQYDFYLVDLNRMRFRDTLDFKVRMRNLSHLTPKKEMVEVISDEYAKLYGLDYATVFEELWRCTSEFKRKVSRKEKMKSNYLYSLFSSLKRI